MTDKQWQTIIDLHATAPFRIIREAAPYFRVKDGEPRSVVMVSSTSGLHGNAGQVNYALGKAGVVGVAKTVAKEYVFLCAFLSHPISVVVVKVDMDDED
jgi:3-oxoacyl-[acyl-carrier protein] reductase